jgi:hypothetical protein
MAAVGGRWMIDVHSIPLCLSEDDEKGEGEGRILLVLNILYLR